eukprot:1133646-Pelagomonas_calceolata.AAC.4
MGYCPTHGPPDTPSPKSAKIHEEPGDHKAAFWGAHKAENNAEVTAVKTRVSQSRKNRRGH